MIEKTPSSKARLRVLVFADDAFALSMRLGRELGYVPERNYE
ncbi:hypothetical protein [Acinetobacter baumannii]|nr:hypothetical protein [Acinetobacter baumannii]